MKNEAWLTDWKVIDLYELVLKIGGGYEEYRKHPVHKEWCYLVEEKSNGSDSGNIEWVGKDEKIPLINEFLLSNGFKINEKVMFWVCCY